MMTVQDTTQGLTESRQFVGRANSDLTPRRLTAWRTAAALACMLAFSSVSVCANAAPYNPDGLPADQVASIGRTCQSVMRLEPNEEHYQRCVESLLDSAKTLNEGRALQAARANCLDQGLQPGGPGFAECELHPAHVQPVRAIATPANDMTAPGDSKSYPYASSRDVLRREQLSCARLGIDPADGAFANCVAGLQSSMFDADHPEQ